MSFIDILAWFFGCLSVLIVIIQLINRWTYRSSMNKIIDNMQGMTGTFPIMKYLIVAVVCWAWVLSKGVLI